MSAWGHSPRSTKRELKHTMWPKVRGRWVRLRPGIRHSPEARYHAGRRSRRRHQSLSLSIPVERHGLCRGHGAGSRGGETRCGSAWRGRISACRLCASRPAAADLGPVDCRALTAGRCNSTRIATLIAKPPEAAAAIDSRGLRGVAVRCPSPANVR